MRYIIRASRFVWAFLTYFMGTRLLPEPQTKPDYGGLLRTIGFSSSPGVLRVLGIIPLLARSRRLPYRMDCSNSHFRIVFLVGRRIQRCTCIV